MARNVFFSFHYENDINRAMVVRNSWVLRGVKMANFIDKADFEDIRRQGATAVRDWIDKQLKDTTVTVVLIGAETLTRSFVQYEITQSLQKGNAIIGVHICNIRDMITKSTSPQGNIRTKIGVYANGSPIYFDNIADSIHDYECDDGYQNLGNWIEAAARKHNK